MTKVLIKGIKVYWSGGKRYAYHRPTKTPLKAPYGTPQFFAELAEIERKYQERRAKQRPLSQERGARWSFSTKSIVFHSSLDERRLITANSLIGCPLSMACRCLAGHVALQSSYVIRRSNNMADVLRTT